MELLLGSLLRFDSVEQVFDVVSIAEGVNEGKGFFLWVCLPEKLDFGSFFGWSKPARALKNFKTPC